MDTSKQYIKMCDCVEVQNFRLPKVEEMKDGRIRSDWGFGDGDTFVLRDNYGGEVREMVVGNTVYSPYRYADGPGGDITIPTVGFDEGDSVYATDWIVFLPRQDQIQEWVWNKDGPVSPLRLFGRFCAFHFTLGPPELSDFHTPEQLWLAFYMYEKHGKVWNGEEWVKSDGEEVWVR